MRRRDVTVRQHRSRISALLAMLARLCSNRPVRQSDCRVPFESQNIVVVSLGGTLGSHVILNRVRGAALENDFVRKLIKIKCAIQARWLAFAFSRRFYRQACKGEGVPSAAPVMVAPVQDLGESLIARSVPPRIHALLQLRVASRIASIAETERCMQSCRNSGWSNEQVGTAVLANVDGSFSEAEKLLLRFADDMTRTPIDVDRQVLRQLRAYFSPADLLEVTAAIAYEDFRTRYRDAAAKLD